jgi:predicted enzyme related to lactoylglutathione lyase
MSAAQGRFVWCELMASDPAAAKSFYGAVVGWTMQDVPMPGTTYTLLKAGETEIGGLMLLPPEARQASVKPCWVAYIAVDDVDAAVTRLQQLGGKVHRAPADIPSVGRFAVVADPQGAVFHLFSALEPRESVASNAAGRVGWRELHATDWPAALTFYGAMFGWGKGNTFEMGASGSYQQFTIGGTPVGGMFNSAAAQRASFWLLYFSVDDIDAAAGRVTAAGGTLLHGPQQVPGGGWILQACDPQGAMFALLGMRK